MPKVSKNNSALELYRSRRQSLLKRLDVAALLVRAAPEVLRNGDVHYSYRQDSNFQYLTGFDEPEAVLVAIPDGKRHRTILFVRPRDKEREIWDGPRAGIDGALRDHGADEAHPIADFWKVFPDLAKNWDDLAFALGVDAGFDQRLLQHFSGRLWEKPRRNRALPTLVDPRPTLHEMRLVKTPLEIEWMQQAASISAAGHCVAMAVAEPGMYEYEIQAELEATFRSHGSPRNGYDSIVASGANACTLHYVRNDRKIRRGDLLLVDAGAEYHHYTADITRTFPVGAGFSDAQRRVYEIVLRCQKRCIAAIRPGVPVRRLLEISWRELTKGLVELGVLKGSWQKHVKKQAFKPWYMHGLGHWLGMDVHDVGAYETPDGKHVPLEPGMITTVEPGLYFPRNDRTIPKELRGIGVRIEDDVLVTKKGHEVLTAAAPKEIRDIEAMTA